MIDVVIIGGGINGLVAATALARDKRSVLVLDQRETVGGAAVTANSPNGFKAPTLSHSLGPLSADVMSTLQLDGARSQLKFLLPDPVLTSLGRSGEIVSFHRDDVLTAASINLISPHDAGAWQTFVSTMQRLAAVMVKSRTTASYAGSRTTAGSPSSAHHRTTATATRSTFRGGNCRAST
jgi:phytoene dehydrogenase-like protein